jgi:MYXO-CTERM domain-containing protein
VQRHLAFALVAVALTFSVSRRASAFCRTTTNETFVPTTDKPCDDTGKPISWASKCVGYSMQKTASVQIDLAHATTIAHDSFAEWAAHDCTPCGAGGPPSIVAQDLGPVSCSNVEYVQDGVNQNAIIFRDGTWPHDSVALALTTVTFKLDSGEIYDADMEIQSNPKEIKLAVSDPVPPDGYDLRSIITHEAGHFLGLAHTQPSNRDATMFATYLPGETLKRDLAQDDVCGLCAAYPPNRAANCAPTPRGGLGDTCGTTAAASKGSCGCSVPGESAPGAGLAVFGLVAALGLTRRVRRK